MHVRRRRELDTADTRALSALRSLFGKGDEVPAPSFRPTQRAAEPLAARPSPDPRPILAK